MRNRSIFALVVSCTVACQGQAALARSPLAWLGLDGSQPHAAQTTEVSQKSRTPAVFAKMTDGTKRFVGNTKKLFTPEKPPVKRRGVTATHRAHNKPEPPKQNFFQRMFHSEPPPPPKTVNEWMALDHVHP